jgi:hypothetical protein
MEASQGATIGLELVPSKARWVIPRVQQTNVETRRSISRHEMTLSSTIGTQSAHGSTINWALLRQEGPQWHGDRSRTESHAWARRNQLSVCHCVSSCGEISAPDSLSHFSDSELQADDSDTAILLALDDRAVACIRELARLIHLPRATVHRRLTESLGFRMHYLRWVPHMASDSHKVARVTRSRELLRMLNQQRVRSCHDIVTLDE